MTEAQRYNQLVRRVENLTRWATMSPNRYVSLAVQVKRAPKAIRLLPIAKAAMRAHPGHVPQWIKVDSIWAWRQDGLFHIECGLSRDGVIFARELGSAIIHRGTDALKFLGGLGISLPEGMKEGK